MSRVFVDTSAWFAFIRADDPDHLATRTAFEKHGEGKVTSNFVFDELVTLIGIRINHKAAVRAGDTLRGSADLEIVRVQPADEEEAWRLFVKRRDKAYSFTDCTTFVLMRRLGIQTAISADRHFKQEGFLVEPF